MILGYVRGFSNKLYTHWDQRIDDYSLKDMYGFTVYAPVYNYYTPYNWVCGCVATMGAAIIQTFNITNSPVAVTNECSVNGMPTNLVTVGGVLDWSILPTSIGGSMKNLGTRVYTDAQRELLGRVTYDMGVTVGMQYTQLESGAQMRPVAVSLTNFWGFTHAEYVPGGLFGLPESLFEPLIYSQLRTGYPVGLGIVSGAGRHAVLAVGYGEDNSGTAYTRIFMGWGGASDAWYQLPKMGSYSLIDAVVTMLSTDENVVPISGRVLLPNGRPASFAEVKIPSAQGGEVIRTGANGWFSARIPRSAVADEEVTATLNGMSGTTTYTVGEEITDPESFYTVIPEALTIRLSGAGDAIPYYSSPEEACAEALETGKVILVLSGDNGEEKTEFLKNYFATNDVAAFNEKCVLYYAEKDLDSYGWQDGVPSVGLFAPYLFSTEGLWLPDNGRFWYKDYTDKEIDVNELQDAILEAYENNVDLEHWVAAQNDNVFFNVSGLTPTRQVGYIGYDTVLAGSPDVGYGEYVNCYTNGEEVIIKGSEFMTNSIIWKCKGWYIFDNNYEPSEQEVYIWLKNQEANVPWLIASGTGTEIKFNAVAGSDWVVYWMWEPVMYKVTASAKNGTIISINGVTGVTEAWFNAGDIVTICAAPNESTVSGRIYEFKGWSGSSDGDFSGDEKLGTTIKVLVSSDRTLTASFELSKSTAFLPKYNVSVNAEATGGLPSGSDPLPSTYVGGTLVANGSVLNIYEGEVSIVPSAVSYTDATGGVWKCVGWANGSGSIGDAGTETFISVNLKADSSFTWLWELQQKEFTIAPVDWSDDLDNLRTDKPFVMAEASTIPAGFDINDLVPLAAPTGWIATPKIDPMTGNLVAEMTLNEEALKPVATDDAPAVITIVPNADGTMTVKASVANGLRGFWYAIYGANSLSGPWSLVKVFQAGGTALEQADQAEEVGEVRLSITVDSNGAQQFYKLVVLESAPE
jgi:hypothetical protein